MSLKFIASILILTFSSLSFADNILGLQSSRSRSDLIPAKTTSCYAKIFDPSQSNDVNASYFEIKSPSLTWADPDSELHILYFQFSIRGIPQSETISRLIDGGELRALFGNPDPQQDNIIPRAPSMDEPSRKQLACNLIVGGIKLTEAQNIPFEAPTTVTVGGLVRNIDGNQDTITASFPITLVNRGKHQE